MTEAILDAIIDSIKILPFLFITYLIMEYLEHKTSEKAKSAIKKSGKFGPIIGGLLGAVPQCGFSVSATNLYAGRVITLRNTNINIPINIRRNASNTNFKWDKPWISSKNCSDKNCNWHDCRYFNRFCLQKKRTKIRRHT